MMDFILTSFVVFAVLAGVVFPAICIWRFCEGVRLQRKAWRRQHDAREWDWED